MIIIEDLFITDNLEIDESKVQPMYKANKNNGSGEFSTKLPSRGGSQEKPEKKTWKHLHYRIAVVCILLTLSPVYKTYYYNRTVANTKLYGTIAREEPLGLLDVFFYQVG